MYIYVFEPHFYVTIRLETFSHRLTTLENVSQLGNLSHCLEKMLHSPRCHLLRSAINTTKHQDPFRHSIYI